MSKAEIAAKAADQILALINAQPRTPSKEAIAAALLQVLNEPSDNVTSSTLLACILSSAELSGPYPGFGHLGRPHLGRPIISAD